MKFILIFLLSFAAHGAELSQENSTIIINNLTDRVQVTEAKVDQLSNTVENIESKTEYTNTNVELIDALAQRGVTDPESVAVIVNDAIFEKNKDAFVRLLAAIVSLVVGFFFYYALATKTTFAKSHDYYPVLFGAWMRKVPIDPVIEEPSEEGKISGTVGLLLSIIAFVIIVMNIT